ncbi:MAG: glycosyltransferase family 2 protein [Chitinophagales bacterium]|nr:glycosyltransferase family 2 protein [Chitinophagales bacterium]
MSEAKKVAVVILGWNGKKFLEQFLPSVVQHTSPDLCEIIVADNCSTDDSVQFVQTHYPRVRVIKNATNSGFAGGYNEALKQVHTEYYVLLNQDVEVTENWVEKVIDEMERDKTIAAAQPKLRDYNKREYFEYAGGSGGYLDRNSYAFCRGRIFNTIEKDTGQYDDVKDIFWATGACMFVRAEAYWKAGALDQDFFAHQEEIDLCWRIKNMGLRIIAVPSSIVYHVGGGSLPQGNPRKTYLNFRNNLMMMFKNLPASTLVPRLFWRFILDGVAALHSVFKNKNFKDLNAILKAHFSFYAAVPALLEKRRKLPHNSAAHLTNINLLWQHFVKGKKKFSEL